MCSCLPKTMLLEGKNYVFTRQKHSFWRLKTVFLQCAEYQLVARELSFVFRERRFLKIFYNMCPFLVGCCLLPTAQIGFAELERFCVWNP